MFDIILKRKEETNVLKGIKLRLYPNRTQQNQLEQMFGMIALFGIKCWP